MGIHTTTCGIVRTSEMGASLCSILCAIVHGSWGMRFFRAVVHCTTQPKNIERLHAIPVMLLLLRCITVCGVVCSAENCIEGKVVPVLN
jgi:hypothetical protein